MALYSTKHDRDWFQPRGVHTGIFTSTILTGLGYGQQWNIIRRKFCVHGNAARRFTFAHIMHRMGFWTADIHAQATILDESFYRRVFTDPSISFLAESQSPKLQVFRGMQWARLMDHWLGWMHSMVSVCHNSNHR